MKKRKRKIATSFNHSIFVHGVGFNITKNLQMYCAVLLLVIIKI